MQTSVLVELKEVQLVCPQGFDTFALKNQSVAKSDLKTREFYLQISLGTQVIEQPLAPDMMTKGATTHLIALFKDSVATVSIVEKIYDLQRDEEAMLKRIQETNLKAQGVENFMMNRMADKFDDRAVTLDTFIDKKKVLEKERVLAKEQINLDK